MITKYDLLKIKTIGIIQKRGGNVTFERKWFKTLPSSENANGLPLKLSFLVVILGKTNKKL